jgi:hypothetical protein
MPPVQASGTPKTSSIDRAARNCHRGEEFTAHDIFDLGTAIEHEPASITQIRPILRDRRQVILDRIALHTVALREVFDALESLDYQRNFDECVTLITRVLNAAV